MTEQGEMEGSGENNSDKQLESTEDRKYRMRVNKEREREIVSE